MTSLTNRAIGAIAQPICDLAMWIKLNVFGPKLMSDAELDAIEMKAVANGDYANLGRADMERERRHDAGAFMRSDNIFAESLLADIRRDAGTITSHQHAYRMQVLDREAEAHGEDVF